MSSSNRVRLLTLAVLDLLGDAWIEVARPGLPDQEQDSSMRARCSSRSTRAVRALLVCGATPQLGGSQPHGRVRCSSLRCYGLNRLAGAAPIRVVGGRQLG
jgi:hypothetical protein